MKDIKCDITNRYHVYFANTKIFKTNKDIIECPSKLKLASEVVFKKDLPIPNRFIYKIVKKEQLKEGDMILVKDIKFADRWYCNGCFYKLGVDLVTLHDALKQASLILEKLEKQ